jgi:hypothetical protein
MNEKIRGWVASVLAPLGALALNSCTYDPNYSYQGSSYSTGYGDGYGYGGRAFTTSVFVGTGDPRWGYDPYCHSYFDYRRRAYYDPYLNGYYPVGYRPQAIYGVAHPYGWNPGSGYCRPPSRVTNVTISSSHNRESAYRNSGYISGGGRYGRYHGPANYNGGDHSYQGHATPQQSRPPSPPVREVSGQGRYPRIESTPRYPSQYNSPVATGQQEISGRGRVRATPQPSQTAQRQIRQFAPPDQSRPPARQQAAPAQYQQARPQNAPAANGGANSNKQKAKAQSGGGRWGGRTEEQ